MLLFSEAWIFFYGGAEMKVADLIGGAVVLLLGLAVIFFSTRLPYSAEYGPGPGFLPLWIGIGITGCASLVIVKIVKKSGRIGVFFKPRTKEGVKILIIMIAAFLLFPLLGFSISLGLFVGVTMRTMGKHRWVSCALTACVTGLAIHYIFAQWLTIPLPTGMVGW